MSSVSDFDFDLPEDLIAQDARPRGTSRLLVVNRAGQSWHEAAIADLPSLLAPGDLIVANDTRVFPARLIGRRDPSGGRTECLLMERLDADHWDALVHPGQKLKPGARIRVDDPSRAPGVALAIDVLERRFFGRRRVRLTVEGGVTQEQAIDQLGHVPLPPYIRRDDTPADIERYQTVYAVARGSIAAPTAGLHFDDALVGAIRAAGIGWTTITLHVGYGTFKPVRVDRVEDHQVDAETYAIGPEAAAAMREARARGRRVVAVGTTTTRAIETAAAADGAVEAGTGATTLFIHPGHAFRGVDALLTNFHLPKSSLLMLVSAFAGRDLVLSAYREAVEQRFRFYSYGDAMLIL
jgi:S-adenosylmethionine:tRNA ribosyltransferase-isomerase